MTTWTLTRHRLHATSVLAVEADGKSTEAQRVGSVLSTLAELLEVFELGDVVRLPDEEEAHPGLTPTRVYWVTGLTNDRGQTRVIGRAAGGMQN